MNLENSQIEISALVNAHEEWLLINSAAGKSFALRRAEIEIELTRGKLLFGFLDEKGFQTWRVENWKFEKGKINFDLTRNFGKERRKIELVPRILAAELAVAVELARQEKANKLARLIVENFPKSKLVRVGLNQETGRFAQIIFESQGKQIAALSDVSGEATTENLLMSAILWLEKLQARKRNSVEKIWILAEKKIAGDLQKLHALLRENRRLKIEIREISRTDAEGQSEKLKRLERLELKDLWKSKPKKIQTPGSFETSDAARKIIELSPAEIDVVFTRHGETLRFSGLSFARVRKIFGEEKIWFGTQNKRQILNEKTRGEFAKLVEDLKTYRRFDSPNKRHAFYFSAPENWLEAILRKNVKRLDANLILSPLYNQFRVSSGERIDLLALRRDGRLIVVELKTAPDRESVFQAANYWRKIELQRRAGNLQKARIFGDAEIADKPAIVYLVAPTLSFHRDINFFAQMISPEIEIIRFDLNENWREELKVLGREVMSDK